MIDVVKVMKAVAYAYEFSEDVDGPGPLKTTGYPLKTAVDTFGLSKEEEAAAWEMLTEILPKLTARYDGF